MAAGGALWRVLSEHWNLHDIPPRWRSALGDEYTFAEPYLRPAGRTRSWLCGGSLEGCARRLDPATSEASCTNEDGEDCGTITVDAAEAHVFRFEVADLLADIATSIGAERDDLEDLPGVHRVGMRRFGNVEARFYFAREATRTALDSVGAHEATLGLGLPVLACPMPPPASVAAIARTRGLAVLPLADVATFTGPGNVTVDLDPLVLEQRFEGANPPDVLSPRRRLILDPAGRRVWLDGLPVPLPRKAHHPWNLLMTLARHPGAELLRPALALQIWREGHASKPSWYDFRTYIRQRREDLEALATWPITDIPGGDDDGGYRLDLAANEVAWWSDPPAEYTARLQASSRMKATNGRGGRRPA